MTPATSETSAQVKARGAFYTPPEIASFIAGWAIRVDSDRVLEPACGDGSFLMAAANRFGELGRSEIPGALVGIEQSPDEAAKSAESVAGADVRVASFFDIDADDVGHRFDAVIGNPPFIRYHGFKGEDRAKGLARASALGVQLTRLASSWAHFVVHATSFLAPGGRLGLVLPAELLVTDYAQPVRAHLLARFSSVLIVTFDRMVFADAQVDALLLLASNDDASGVRVVRVTDAAGLSVLDLAEGIGIARAPGPRWYTSIDADAEAVYREISGSGNVMRLSELGSVDIGIVTGANRFFVLSTEEATRRRLPDDALLPVVERPGDVRGLAVRHEELRRLLRIPSDDPPSDPAVLRYLREGRRDRVDAAYKCRVRRHWYAVPLPKTQPAAFLPYMTADVPRLIVNESGAWSTNLLHGVAFKAGAPHPKAVSAAMLSSVTALSAEVEGRSYGGGVLKLETRESERLLVPAMSPDQADVLTRLHGELDSLLRGGRGTEASRIVDTALGIDREPLQKARLVFRARRLERRTGPTVAPVLGLEIR